MQRCTIFFSWASEYPDNKRFILEILEKAKQSLIGEGIDIEIQESTSELPGFVNIESVIFQRIEKCDFFVADLSIVGDVSGKKTPNPNVCFELGLMMGRHGESRVFGLYNEDYIGNPSLELPFDFSHNRAMRFRINKDDAARTAKKAEYAEVIAKTISQFKVNGDLYSHQPIKEHDIKLNADIVENMEHFKNLICGFTERLEVYNGTDAINHLDGDYDFLYKFIANLDRIENRFANSSLESHREKLRIAITAFVDYQSCHTHEYFRDCGSFRKCTKLYLIENHPEKCERYKLPCIYDDTKKEVYKKQMKPFIEESSEYRDLAHKALQSYIDLEDRYCSLLQ